MSDLCLFLYHWSQTNKQTVLLIFCFLAIILTHLFFPSYNPEAEIAAKNLPRDKSFFVDHPSQNNFFLPF